MSDRARRILNIVLSLVIAAAGWFFVVYNYYPNTDVKYKDVPITFIGEETLADRGYVIAASSRDSIDVTINQKRVNSNNITSDSITVIADISNAVDGENGISLQVSSPDGTQVKETSAKSVSVTVERSVSREMDIAVKYSDPHDDDKEPIVRDMSSVRATVMTTEGSLEQISEIVAYIVLVDAGTLDRNFSRRLVAIDKDGEEITHAIIYPAEISFTATGGTTKEVKLNLMLKDNLDDGYERTYTAPDTIVIKGPEEIVSGITSIDSEDINIGQYYDDQEIALSYELPEGVVLADKSIGLKMYLKCSPKPPEEEETEEEQTDGEQAGEDSGN